MTAAASVFTPAPKHHQTDPGPPIHSSPAADHETPATPPEDDDATSDVTMTLIITARMSRFDGPESVRNYVIELIRTAASARVGNITAVTVPHNGDGGVAVPGSTVEH